MIWVNFIAVLILFFSFIGGLKEGAVKSFFSLLALIIAIPIAGLNYRLLAVILSFLPGTNWENFVGFFVVLGITSLLFQLIFLLPRKILQKMWGKGVLFRLLGGLCNLLNSGIGLALFTLVIGVFPIFDWLARVVTHSGILVWLIENLSFVQAMLPDLFRQAAFFVAG